MIDHVTIGVSDREASEAFYETVLATVGISKTHSDETFVEWNDFSLGVGSNDRALTRRSQS